MPRRPQVTSLPQTYDQAGERCAGPDRQAPEMDAASVRPRTQAVVKTGRLPTDGRHRWAHACRNGEVLCGRVELTVRADMRLGLTARERRCLAARFVEHLHPALRDELNRLVDRRGAAARRAAERIEPIELVFDDPRLGLQRITGWIEPPQHRRNDLHEIEFGLREPTP